eukprot:TRINITY_DN1245_c1_g5_i1.p1 TRINITY_DN1245_c1_g5~~TRINITY_DN1245_c1_g5_i1.p1  ORF type:complete len:353 (-),score=74.37 TRINITY_DN1245_c1_g5_i1:19-1077(-)
MNIQFNHRRKMEINSPDGSLINEDFVNNSSNKKRKKNRYSKRNIAKILLVIVLFSFIGFFLIYYIPWTDYIARFLTWVESLGNFGVLILMLSFVFISFPFTFGYIPLSLGAGYLYGIFLGTLSASIGATTGALICFILFRNLLLKVKCCSSMLLENESIKQLLFNKETETIDEEEPNDMDLMNENKEIDDYISENSNNNNNNNIQNSVSMMSKSEPSFVLATLFRLAPFPFGFSNALLSLTSIGWKKYALTTFLGLFPFQVMWVYLGTTVRSLTDVAQGNIETSYGQIISLTIQLFVGIVVPVYLVIHFKQKITNLKNNNNNATNSSNSNSNSNNNIKIRKSKESNIITEYV